MYISFLGNNKEYLYDDKKKLYIEFHIIEKNRSVLTFLSTIRKSSKQNCTDQDHIKDQDHIQERVSNEEETIIAERSGGVLRGGVE
jgi:hypothetical protein